jgi:hypothetical protein
VITVPDLVGDSVDHGEAGKSARTVEDAYRRGYRDGLSALEKATADARKALSKTLA